MANGEQRHAEEQERAKAAYTTVGELVLLFSALDSLLNRVIITVLDLGPVVN